MDLAKAFKFVFEDPEWIKKILLLGVISLIPVVGIFVLMGFALETAQRVIRQDPKPLPDLDFGSQLGLGFKGTIVNLIYMVPMIVISIPMYAAPLAMMDESGNPSPAGMIIMVCCGGLMFLYGLALAVTLPAAIGNFLSTGQIGSALRFGEVIALVRAAPGAYLLALVGGAAASFVASLGMVACGIGVLFTMPYAMVVMYGLYGQAYRVSIANGALRY